MKRLTVLAVTLFVALFIFSCATTEVTEVEEQTEETTVEEAESSAEEAAEPAEEEVVEEEVTEPSEETTEEPEAVVVEEPTDDIGAEQWTLVNATLEQDGKSVDVPAWLNQTYIITVYDTGNVQLTVLDADVSVLGQASVDDSGKVIVEILRADIPAEVFELAEPVVDEDLPSTYVLRASLNADGSATLIGEWSNWIFTSRWQQL